MNLTKEETIKFHREIWNWCSENPKKNKQDWPGWDNFDVDSFFLNDCFLCQYTENNNTYCDKCPLDWEITETCNDDGSYYDLYCNYKGRSKNALKIANLKEKK